MIAFNKKKEHSSLTGGLPLVSTFNRIFTPRHTDWISDKMVPENPKAFKYVHNIGSPPWVHSKGAEASAEFFETTNFNKYFSNQLEVIQATSYDFIWHYFEIVTTNTGLEILACTQQSASCAAFGSTISSNLHPIAYK